METLEQKLGLIERHISRAVAAVTSDLKASPVLRAVVGELEKKSRKAREAIVRAGEAGSRESVVEVEQAADSARVAAEADTGAGAETRKLVSVAHDAICLLKHEQGKQ